MEAQKLYRQQRLSIRDLGTWLGIPEYRLRRLINCRFLKSIDTGVRGDDPGSAQAAGVADYRDNQRRSGKTAPIGGRVDRDAQSRSFAALKEALLLRELIQGLGGLRRDVCGRDGSWVNGAQSAFGAPKAAVAAVREGDCGAALGRPLHQM
jgi:hypothetical protein